MAAAGETRAQVMQLVEVYRARVVDVSPESLVIETTGTEDKIDSLLEVLRPYGVIEMVRTGRVAMARGTARRRRRSRAATRSRPDAAASNLGELSGVTQARRLAIQSAQCQPSASDLRRLRMAPRCITTRTPISR